LKIILANENVPSKQQAKQELMIGNGFK